MMFSCGRNQWTTSSSPIEGASWKRRRCLCSSSVTCRTSCLSIGLRPGVLVLFREWTEKTHISHGCGDKGTMWMCSGSGHCCVYIWQPVELHGSLQGHVSAQVGELHLHKLSGVQGTMPIPVCRNTKRVSIQKKLLGLTGEILTCLSWRPLYPWRTCMWTRVWVGQLRLCTQPGIFLPDSPSVWSPWSAPEPRALNAASCEHTGSWFQPSSLACNRKGR